MVSNPYIEKLEENSNSSTSCSLPCGCELMTFEFNEGIRPRTLIHRCTDHKDSMVVGSGMDVYQQYQREPEK